MTITGTNLNCGPTRSLAFNGVPAIITSVSPTVIKTFIPLGGQDGLFTFTTEGGTVTAPPGLAFDVVLSRDFSLVVAPVDGQVLQGTFTTYTVELQSLSPQPFTGLAILDITGLPTGVTATFAAPTLTGGQRTTLTVSAEANAPLGSAPLTLRAMATVDAKPVTRMATLTLNVLADNRIALLGQFTFLDGTPLAGVVLSLAGQQTQTDGGGNFQFLDLPAGTYPLSVNVTPVDPQLPMYGMDVTLQAGEVLRLPPFRIHPPLPPERYTPIQNATQDQVITDPRFPGAAFILPAGVTIIGWNGKPKTQMAIERLSPDQLPVPPPPGETRSVYQPFFGTPMGGLPSAPIPVTLPNDLDLKPGEKAELWYYDAAPFPGVPGAWRLAGMGTVSADGATIVSDPGVGITQFCGVCGLSCFLKRIVTQLNRLLHAAFSGDPVDVFLGQMIEEKTDLVLPGRIPAVIHRTYNPIDPFGGIAGFELALGPGWALSVEMVLLAEAPALRRLILPGNVRFAFVRQADGTFVNTTDPNFAGAVLVPGAGGRDTLRLKDGTRWLFAPGPVSGLSLLVEQIDRNSNHLTIVRDSRGHILRLVEPAERVLTFTYTNNRLTEVRDPLGRTVRYGYDSASRLETVTDPAGGVTRYTYDASGGISTITDPKGIVFLRNEYGTTPDGLTRVIRQEEANGGGWQFEYLFPPPCIRTTLTGAPSKTARALSVSSAQVQQGGILPIDPDGCLTPRNHIGTRVTDPQGHITTYLFNHDGSVRVRTDALGQNTSFERDASGGLVSTTDPLGRVTRFTYDAAGNVLQITDPIGNVRSFEYEPVFNRPIRLTDPVVLCQTLILG